MTRVSLVEHPNLNIVLHEISFWVWGLLRRYSSVLVTPLVFLGQLQLKQVPKDEMLFISCGAGDTQDTLVVLRDLQGYFTP